MSGRSLGRRAAKRDAAEASIVSALRAMGALVFPLSAEDLPDLLVGFRERWHLLEVKGAPGPKGGTSKRTLRDGQRKFRALALAAGLPVAVVSTPEDAILALGVVLKASVQRALDLGILDEDGLRRLLATKRSALATRILGDD